MFVVLTVDQIMTLQNPFFWPALPDREFSLKTTPEGTTCSKNVNNYLNTLT
jgi:hypothetical protein